MIAPVGAAPLLAIDAVAIDTETTGLDPSNARVVELAAVRIEGGRTLRSFLRKQPGRRQPHSAGSEG